MEDLELYCSTEKEVPLLSRTHTRCSPTSPHHLLHTLSRLMHLRLQSARKDYSINEQSRSSLLLCQQHHHLRHMGGTWVRVAGLCLFISSITISMYTADQATD
ncbi:hypothetical protein FRX31_031317 [Thalictrum thalictroides]|uniref:Uncharacterized protein n=1 Tax=Thalictrum thalictroides TaxID=46969 RepID=A0A7J6V2Q9_THATH|nr:hypothetical protein FRX31_031317 [Thalictrum thalictroides]